MRNKPTIKKGQIWKQKTSEMQVIITGVSGGKWRSKVLTDRPGVYAGSHTMSPHTLYLRYELVA